MPIDTFGFFDTGYNILKGQLPIRDYWAYTGLTVDYFQSFFFLVFGNTWSSYLIHSSFLNVIASIFFYFFLSEIKISAIYRIIYSLSFATLLYPVSGTPFAYMHSFVFSLIAIMIFFISYNSKKYFLLLFLPIIFFLGFFSMQTPIIYIFILMIPFLIVQIINAKDFLIIKYLSLGTLICFIFFFFYLLITKTLISDIMYQYFLFPISIGEGRIISDEGAYVRLIDQINFKRIFGDFKFIHIFLIPLIFIQFINLKYKKYNKKFVLSLIVILSTILFIYNQLTQANQIYIFALVPLLASVLHFSFDLNNKKFLSTIVIVILLFASFKFHNRFNIERKFIELEDIDKTKAIDASYIHKNLKGLKWINNEYPDPKIEIDFLKQAIEIIKKDKRKKMLITHYQFISTVLEEDLNLLNRWYLWDNNSHPTINHKYFNVYKNLSNKKLIDNNIEVIYMLGKKMKFRNFKKSFPDVCFEDKIISKKLISMHKIIDC